MGRIVLLWLLLTPLWIAFSFYASVSKIAFIPPALVVIALVFHWLHKQLVLGLAGESEPRANAQSSGSSHFHPVAAPLSGFVRPAFVALGVGACVGAAATSFFLLDRPLHEFSGFGYERNCTDYPTKLHHQRANRSGEIAIVFCRAKNRANRTGEIAIFCCRAKDLRELTRNII